jgi:hypothetical protein
MANVNSYGQLISRSGAVIPVLNAATTESTADNVQTDPNFVGSAQDVGTYGNQLGRFVLSRGGWICETDSSWNYIRSAGVIKAVLPFGSGKDGGCTPLPAPLPYAKELESGDQLIVMANAVTDRTASVSVACSNGEYHVFAVEPSGSGSHEFVSVLTGNGIGTTLQGRTCTHWMAYSGNNDAEVTSSVMLLDGSGIPTASLGFTSSGGAAACQWQPSGGVQIHLNSSLTFRTDG